LILLKDFRKNILYHQEVNLIADNGCGFDAWPGPSQMAAGSRVLALKMK